MHSVFEHFGLTLNFKPGPSEVVIKTCEPNSTHTRKNIFADNCGNMPVPSLPGGARLHGTTAYKHLGSMVAASGHLKAERGFAIV